MVNATFDALKKMESPRQVASRRGKKVGDIIVNRDGAKAAGASEEE
jgi:small subunit ribosomal protein S5